MKKLLLVALGLVIAYQLLQRGGVEDAGPLERPSTSSLDQRSTPPATVEAQRSSDAIQAAFEQQRSNLQVEASGVVNKVLGDDNDGSRHQRFIVRLDSGLTLLIAHNIDLAPRVENIRPGDPVTVYGEYEWNNKGGVIHWTHHDPQGQHVAGWILHGGRRYQ